MNSSLGPHSKSRRPGPSPLLVATVLVPTLVLLGYLILWAYRIREWTWFGLLVAAGIGLLAFTVAPEMFAIRDTEAAVLTLPSADDLRGKAVAGGVGTSVPPKDSAQGNAQAPDRTA